MAGITLRTARQVVPMIYAYTTPEIARHNGWTKIGYTEQSVDKRLKQQTHTADVLYHEEWRGNAVYDDGSGEVFTDHDFHAYLRKLNVENDRKNEWFHLDGEQSRQYFQDYFMFCMDSTPRTNTGTVSAVNPNCFTYSRRNFSCKWECSSSQRSR